MDKFITYKGQCVDFNAAWDQMDVELREKAWRMTSDAQSCFDNYVEMHEEKFGKPFEVQSTSAKGVTVRDIVGAMKHESEWEN